MQNTLFLLCLLASPLALYASVRPYKNYRGSGTAISTATPVPQYQKVGLDLCPTCIQFTGEAINELLNIILNLGVVGSCGKVCSALEQKTGSQALGLVCDLLCDYVGIEEFIKLIQKADLDPFYFCELIKICPIFDTGDATITQLSVTPLSGPQGPKQIAVAYTSKNGTGTGEIIVGIQTVDGLPIENGFVHDAQPAGTYPLSLTLKAEPDPNCDPSQGFCEQWLPGNYSVTVDVCNGECGSAHPNSKVYDRKTTGFIITEN
ncbi:hypothetical protein SNE40_011130 [Patella caerulea]|uniref:Saposin B-type domain-containing protein n=1 Tax=Patella caerulea TaxID=87958 RepID=A0AAN8PTH5_PATCE